QLMALTLTDEGHEVRSVSDGSKAIAEVEDAEPDAIVLDLEMPVMGGRACFRELRRRGVTAPVVLVSANGARDAQRELGAEDAIEKPFDLDEFVSHVARLAS